jgi:hypothetical protein
VVDVSRTGTKNTNEFNQYYHILFPASGILPGLCLGICAPLFKKNGLLLYFPVDFPGDFLFGNNPYFSILNFPERFWQGLKGWGQSRFFLNFPTPYFWPGCIKVTGQFPDW